MHQHFLILKINDAMKNRIIAAVLPAFILLIISCTAVDKNKSVESSSGNKKEIAAKSKKTTRTSLVKDRSNENHHKTSALSNRANEINNYANQKGYSTKYCFLIDMSVPSGRNRFFVYDLENNSVAYSGLVAHGCCNETFISHQKFSNSSN